MDYVLGFIIDPYARRVLLIRKNKPEWQKGNFNGIGGKVEKSADSGVPGYAMVRECTEETSAYIQFAQWIPFCTMVGKDCPDGDWNVYCFYHITKNPDDKYAFVTTEKEMVYWFDLQDIHTDKQKLLGNIPWLVGMAVDHYLNHNFRPVEVFYTGGFSLPLNF